MNVEKVVLPQVPEIGSNIEFGPYNSYGVPDDVIDQVFEVYNVHYLIGGRESEIVVEVR